MTPNFFISETYFSQSSLIGMEKENWIWIEEDGMVLFPALPRSNVITLAPVDGYWASFPNMLLYGGESSFLDYQYIYDPKAFLNMEGKKWQTFRKNSRKFPNRNPNCIYTDKANENNVRELLLEWLKDKEDTAQDADFLVNCILFPNKKKDYIKYLYSGEELIAINFADENYKYINYRFLICKNKPFADEYARLCFYLDPIIQNKNKLVNDGGCLDSEGLEKFKDKLNPLQKLKIYSLKN